MLQKDRFVFKLLTLCVIMRKQTLHALVFNLLFQLQFLESTIEDFKFREYTEFEFNSKKTQTEFENVCKETQTCQTDAIKERKDVYTQTDESSLLDDSFHHSLDHSLETESLESSFHMSETETESSEEEHPYANVEKSEKADAIVHTCHVLSNCI